MLSSLVRSAGEVAGRAAAGRRGQLVKVKYRTRTRARELRKTLTDAEAILWSKLQRKGLHGYRFRSQHPVGPFIADFACHEARLIIELDGATHSTEDERLEDAKREAYDNTRDHTGYVEMIIRCPHCNGHHKLSASYYRNVYGDLDSHAWSIDNHNGFSMII